MDAQSPTERAVADAFDVGRPVMLEGDPQDRTVRGEFLAELLVGPASSGTSRRAALRLEGARVTGPLDLHGARVEVPVALTRCRLAAGPVFRDASFVSLRLPGCSCPGLDATNVVVEGNLELNDGFSAHGAVVLERARIGGDLRLTRAVLQNLDREGGGKRALVASRMTVGGALLAGYLQADGQVRLISARINGLLSLTGARLRNPAGIALQGERLEVGESLFLQRGFTAEGRIFLQNATVKGGIDASGATLGQGPPNRPVFQLLRGTAGRNVSLAGATIRGSVDVRAAVVGGRLSFDGATFEEGPEAAPAAGGDELTGSEAADDERPAGRPDVDEPDDDWAESTRVALNASSLRAVELDLRFAMAPGAVDLRHARVELLRDAKRSWPARLRLHGCTYQALESPPSTSLADRLEWVCRDASGYRPFAYDQLVAAYRSAGDEQGARRVGLEKERRRRRILPWPGRIVGWVQDATVGYGYRNGRAVVWIGALIALAAGWFAYAPPVPKRDAPAFQPIVFAADTLLPIVDFGQAGSFVPQGAGRFVVWALVAGGWVLTTAVVAGISRLLNRT